MLYGNSGVASVVMCRRLKVSTELTALHLPFDSLLWKHGWRGWSTGGLARVPLAHTQANSVAHRHESADVFKGFIGATLSPSQCCRNPLVLLLPLLFGDMGGKAGRGPAIWGEMVLLWG